MGRESARLLFVVLARKLIFPGIVSRWISGETRQVKLSPDVGAIDVVTKNHPTAAFNAIR